MRCAGLPRHAAWPSPARPLGKRSARRPHRDLSDLRESRPVSDARPALRRQYRPCAAWLPEGMGVFSASSLTLEQSQDEQAMVAPRWSPVPVGAWCAVVQAEVLRAHGLCSVSLSELWRWPYHRQDTARFQHDRLGSDRYRVRFFTTRLHPVARFRRHRSRHRSRCCLRRASGPHHSVTRNGPHERAVDQVLLHIVVGHLGSLEPGRTSPFIPGNRRLISSSQAQGR